MQGSILVNVYPEDQKYLCGVMCIDKLSHSFSEILIYLDIMVDS